MSLQKHLTQRNLNLKCSEEGCDVPLWAMFETESKICTACMSRKKREHAQKYNQRVFDHKQDEDP
tara:strand:- start:260 stop:454 length:195 start_codon:yes stop_codon:yes gene_type:complete